MIKTAGMILSLITLFQGGCEHYTSLPEMTSVSSVFIVTNERKRIKEIADPKQMREIVDFVNMQRTNWRSPAAGVPVPSVILEFYEGDQFKGTFGVGNGFFETQRSGSLLSKRISHEDEKRFLDLIGVGEEMIRK